jgi:hypothetical protein
MPGGQSLFSDVMFSCFSKEFIATSKTAQSWHQHISGWMEKNGYVLVAVNNEETIFVKRQGNGFTQFTDDHSQLIC